MIEERLEQTFTNLGYRRMNSNAAGIYLYYLEGTAELTVVSIVHAVTGNELGKEQYENILGQIRNNFVSSNPFRMRLLSLILTTAADKVKQLSTESSEGEHWILDLRNNRLIIYETISDEFSEIRRSIEALLIEEERLRQVYQEPVRSEENPGPRGYTSGQSGLRQSRPGSKLFTLVNTLIILVNIIVFLLTHYTPIYGGWEQMFFKGALSWYYVFAENEYYRLLTSMFMHSDFSHIFNNMLVLFFLGDNLERAAGKLRYLFLYFGTGILAGITSISYNMWKESGQFLI
jgi:rhomboid protease GluP